MSNGTVFGIGTMPLSMSFPSAVQHEECDADGCVSPASVPPPLPAARCKDVTLLETPARKNKRKLKKPQKLRADMDNKHRCQNSPGGSAMSESCCSDDSGEDSGVLQRLHPGLCLHEQESSTRGASQAGPGPATGSSSDASLNASSFLVSRPERSSASAVLPGFHLAADGPPGLLPHPFPPLPTYLPSPGYVSAMVQHGGASQALHLDLYGPQSLHLQALSCQANSPYTQDLSGEEDGTNITSRGRRSRRNYKNMSRARRVEANARERTRVHTISAAFEALRRAVPCYSCNQKLSKLAILKIASTYIMALARLADVDCSQVSEPSIPVTFAECVDLCTRTIEVEGRPRKKH